MDVKKELKKVASQQRVPLTEEEKEKFSLQLGQVLEAFKKLDSADTSSIEPSYHPLEIPSQFREDTPENPTSPTQNAQRTEKGYIRGPRMMRHQ